MSKNQLFAQLLSFHYFAKSKDRLYNFDLMKQAIKKYSKIFISGVLAGVFIGIGGLAYILSTSYGYKELGAFSFSIGLLLVCLLGAKLYTGQIGFVIENRHKFIALDLFIILIGNLIGAAVFGSLMFLVFQSNEGVMATAQEVVSARLNLINLEKFYLPFITSFFCGMFVFLAVYFFKIFDNYFVKIFLLVFLVFLFVYLGFEHCIANMFYFVFNLRNFDPLKVFLNLLITITGNSVGAIITYLMTYLLRKSK